MLTIKDINILNKLNEKCGIMLNNCIHDGKYDYYFENDIKWLFDNEKMINKDFEDNVNDFKFDVLLNTKFIFNDYVGKLLKFKDVKEFNNYINYVPYNLLNKHDKENLSKKYDKFNNIQDFCYKVDYFNTIKRK